MRRKIESQRGTVLMVAMILVLLLSGLAVAYVAITGSQALSTNVSYKSDRALYLAEAGLADSMYAIEHKTSGNVAESLAGGSYAVDTHPDGTMNLVITSTGTFGDTERTVEIVAYDGTHPVFFHAIFAGDSTEDANYWMKFGGVDGGSNQRWQDEVTGDVYSGGNILVKDDAEMNGNLRAEGDIVGATGSHMTLPIPDLVAMDYPHNNDINVKNQFQQYGSYSTKNSSSYGKGYTVPESNPAHIFHKNPSDRATECAMTPGDDYFMEDIYENCPNQMTRISVAPTGNDKVYFVEGDLWLHNKNTYGFQLKDPDTHITIVVQGSIHLADDFHYHNDVKSGVAFIAIKAPNDPHGEYSGNVYIGDPVFGTIEELNSFLYAENNFVDENLDEGGSAEFYINGMMTAGNWVTINRDFSGTGGYWKGAYPHRTWVSTGGTGTHHSKMVVKLDDRILTGKLVLPRLPEIDPGTGQWAIIAWRERS